MVIQHVETTILMLRGQKVLLSTHLAELNEVLAEALVQAVKRNAERFPADFMFQLTDEEFANLKPQTVTSSWGGQRRGAPPHAWQGVAMLSTVLRSRRVVLVNIEIMRTFVRLREFMAVTPSWLANLQLVESRSRGVNCPHGRQPVLAARAHCRGCSSRRPQSQRLAIAVTVVLRSPCGGGCA
jgi:hypothetical protein